MTTSRPDAARGAFDNPWNTLLWVATALVLLAGIITTSSAPDPEAFDYNPDTVALGRLLLGVGGVLLTGTLVSGAVCWQLRRR